VSVHLNRGFQEPDLALLIERVSGEGVLFLQFLCVFTKVPDGTESRYMPNGYRPFRLDAFFNMSPYPQTASQSLRHDIPEATEPPIH
jgi:hypothetical protein